MTEASRYAWFNGHIVEREAAAPSVASINFHLGTSVFDGLMAYHNGDHYYLHRAEEHLVRFRRGALRMGLPLPCTAAEMLSGIEALLALEPAGTQYVRPIAYRRGPELWVTGAKGRPVDVCIFTVRVKRDIDDLISCQISPIERISSRSIPSQTKVSGAYVNSYHARDTAEVGGYDDGIMLDRRGCVAEASAANVFFIRGERLITPALTDDIFPGITREVVIELARSTGIDLQQQDIRPADLDGIDGAFLCSTLMEVRGLSRIDRMELETVRAPVFCTIVRSLRAMTHS